MPRRRAGPSDLLAVLLWLASFAAIAALAHAALFFFPAGWRWVNAGRSRTVSTTRAAIALILALPLSMWTVTLWPSRGRRLREAEAARAGARGKRRGNGEAGCGAILVALVAAALLLRPAVLLLFPLAGLDPDDGGLLPFLLWLLLCWVLIAATRGAAATRWRRRRGAG